MSNLFSQVVKPKIRKILTEAYRDVKYQLSEQEYAKVRLTEMFSRTLNTGFDKLFNGVKVRIDLTCQ